MRVGKKIFVGLESSGKSLLMAREAVWNVRRNARWNKITGLSRPIVGNLAWSDEFLEYAASYGVEVKSWQHIADLPDMQECDLYIDELGTYFDSRLYQDIPLRVRLWVAQAEKMGVQIVGGAQDFGQVDKAFRRLCKEVYEVKKIVGSRRPMKTAPPVKWVWGFGLRWQLDPRSFDGEQIEMKTLGIFPIPFLIRKQDVKMFSTSQRVLMSEPAPLEHIARFCKIPDCSLHHKPKIVHR